MELVIATGNVHKTREIKSFLKKITALDLYTLRDFPQYTPPKEVQDSFEGNAILKATSAAQALNKWVIADDSGLVVPALNGDPGVYSARYAGSDATDKDNRKKLLAKMAHLKDLQRSAYFSCTIVIASPEKVEKTVTSTCEGVILEQDLGHNGFGYDSLFLKHDYSKTFAQLDESIKNQISHRGKALRAILFYLESLPQLIEETENLEFRYN